MLAEAAKHDPLKWTAQDRITALWWIFTGSRETPIGHLPTPVNIAVKSIITIAI
ncbi:hypothetical protein CSC22_5362 (plasmid) [Escherichia coli]|nr:hypothetical protein CSC22_5362 [Escherichia coli]